MRQTGAVEGFQPGGPDVSEPYDDEDAVDVEAEDEDHAFISDRAGRCQVCGQTQEACTEEP